MSYKFTLAVKVTLNLSIRPFEVMRETGSRWLSSALWDCFGGRTFNMAANLCPKTVPQCTLTTISTQSSAQSQSGELSWSLLGRHSLSFGSIPLALMNGVQYLKILLLIDVWIWFFIFYKVFGPVLTVLTFRTAKEGIALANNTNYGLAGSVWTENLSLALEVALSIKAGSLWVNGHNMFDAAAGFGGYRESGFGRDGGKEVRSKSQSCSQAHSSRKITRETARDGGKTWPMTK